MVDKKEKTEEPDLPVTPADQIRISIGEKIQRIRKSRGQSGEVAGKKIGISRVGLTHIENGDNNINAVQLWKLACILGCEVSDFFPPIPKGYAPTPTQYRKIGKEDESAEAWARELFSDEF